MHLVGKHGDYSICEIKKVSTVYIKTNTARNVTANANFNIYIRRFDDINVQTGKRDLLHCTQGRPLYSNHEAGFFMDKIGGRGNRAYFAKGGGNFW